MKSFRLVSHPVFGEGEVINSRWQGSELLVRFQTGLRLWLPKSRLRFLFPFDEELLNTATAAVGNIDRVSACRMVESFRLGIVPHQNVELFTLGREEETKILESALANLKQECGDAYLIEGEYGTGKTHLLKWCHHRALKQGVVATVVQLDPVEVSPHRPKRIYREIVKNLTFIEGEKEGGFRDLLGSALDLNLTDHPFWGPVLRKLKRLKPDSPESEVFWQWIEGESTKEYATKMNTPYRVRSAQRIPALYDFSTASDFYCNIISGLAIIAKELGKGGLLLLIDEAETVTRLWDIIYLTKSINFIHGLIRTAQNDPQLKHLNDQMIHNQVRPVPYIYRDPPLLLLLAATPTPGHYGYIRLANAVRHRIELKPLDDQALTNGFATMVKIYQCAYPDFHLPVEEQKKILAQALGQSGARIRVFVKFCVEVLDIARLRQRGLVPIESAN